MMCKPTSWEDLDTDFIPFPKTPIRYTAKALGLEASISADLRHPAELPRVFILVRGDKEYLVDRGGYHYARYVQRIK